MKGYQITTNLYLCGIVKYVMSHFIDVVDKSEENRDSSISETGKG